MLTKPIGSFVLTAITRTGVGRGAYLYLAAGFAPALLFDDERGKPRTTSKRI